MPCQFSGVFFSLGFKLLPSVVQEANPDCLPVYYLHSPA